MIAAPTAGRSWWLEGDLVDHPDYRPSHDHRVPLSFPAKPGKMRATVHADDDGRGFVVEVEHDPRQSFTRAVDPAGMRHGRAALSSHPGIDRTARGWAITASRYGVRYAGPARCVSVFRFDASA